jgi:hypothetical protein
VIGYVSQLQRLSGDSPAASTWFLCSLCGAVGDNYRASAQAIDRDKSPLLDADHDVVRIADALRGSPHIRFVDATEPGDETVWFTDADGIGYELSLATMEPIPDAPQGVAHAWDAVAAAIGNHPDFVSAGLAQEGFGPYNLDTITALTPHGQRVHPEADRCPSPRLQEGAGLPAADVETHLCKGPQGRPVRRPRLPRPQPRQ